jgi:hypothetical protein
LVTNFARIEPKHLEANLEAIVLKWNPEDPIQRVFTNGNKCRQFALAGGEPIPDTAYVRTLIKIFKNSGVLEKAVIDFEEKPLAQQTVAVATDHFKRADAVRRANSSATKSILAANQAIAAANQTKAIQDTIDLIICGWGYCWSHGVNKTHTGKTCTAPRNGHIADATLNNRKGGSTNIQGTGNRNTNGGGRGGRGGGRNRNNTENVPPPTN